MKKGILLSVLVIAVAALTLFTLSTSLEAVAEKNLQIQQLKLMQTILPGSETFTAEAYTGEDANIQAVYKAETGFVVQTCTQGYAGPVSMLVAVSNEGKVVGLVVTDLSETLGLGTQVLTDHEFLAQFLNTDGDVTVGTGADAFSGATGASSDTGVYVDGVTGATVTSKAIQRSIRSAVAFVTGAEADSGATSWGG
jgi:electron transport complex protein RnfG